MVEQTLAQRLAHIEEMYLIGLMVLDRYMVYYIHNLGRPVPPMTFDEMKKGMREEGADFLWRHLPGYTGTYPVR